MWALHAGRRWARLHPHPRNAGEIPVRRKNAQRTAMCRRMFHRPESCSESQASLPQLTVKFVSPMEQATSGFLGLVPLFSELSPDTCARLEGCMRRVDYEPQAVIVREGS